MTRKKVGLNTLEDVKPRIQECVEKLYLMVEALPKGCVSNATINEFADLLQQISEHADGRL